MSNVLQAEVQTVEVTLEVQLIKDGDYIVSYCPALELSSFGDSEQDAKEGFDEALAIFLDELHKRGSLEKVLLNLGWGLRKLPKVSFQPPLPETMKLYPKPAQSTFNERVSIPVF